MTIKERVPLYNPDYRGKRPSITPKKEKNNSLRRQSKKNYEGASPLITPGKTKDKSESRFSFPLP